MAERASLSVVMICYNEEENIREALESVRFSDEIVVVDSGSTDRTVAICREYTDRIVFQPWLGFSEQKNRALSHATHDWVFVLDADERVPPPLQKELLSLLEGPPPLLGYSVPRKNFFRGHWIRYGGWYPDHTLRFFNRRKGRFADRAVHERVEVNGPTGTLKNPIDHYTYRDLSDYMMRMQRYSSLAAEEMRKEGRKFRRTDLWLRPPITFLKMYLLRQGFRDQLDGLILSGLYACYTFAKYAKLAEMELAEKD